MKKWAIPILLVLGLLGLYWYWPGPAPSLPSSDDVVAVELSTQSETAFLVEPNSSLRITDPDDVASLLTVLSQSSKTRQESVQDSPYAERYARLDITFKDGQTSSLAYLYPKGGRTYLEQPYVGIYKLNQPIERWLAERD